MFINPGSFPNDQTYAMGSRQVRQLLITLQCLTIMNSKLNNNNCITEIRLIIISSQQLIHHLPQLSPSSAAYLLLTVPSFIAHSNAFIETPELVERSNLHAISLLDQLEHIISEPLHRFISHLSPQVHAFIISLYFIFIKNCHSLLNMHYKHLDMTVGCFMITMTALLALSISKLYQVVAVISPGARYHLNNLYDGQSTASMWGQLTPVGARQLQNLGQITRKQYIDTIPLLSQTFRLQQIEIYSTSSNRSIISSLAHLYGIYSLGNGQKIQPVQLRFHFPPFVYKNDANESNFAVPRGQILEIVRQNKGLIGSCQNEQIEIEKNKKQQQSQYDEMMLTYSPFLKQIASIFKIDPSVMNFKKLADLYDTVNVDRYLARPLPNQLGTQQLQNMEHLYNWYNHFTTSFNLSRAYSTFKINKIVQNFDAILKNPSASSLKWTTLSVDLKDVVALRNDLNISSAHCIEELYRKGSTSSLNCEKSVPFASSLMFQLHSENQQDFYVRIRHNGKYVYLCQQKKYNCSYHTWKGKVSQIQINTQQVCGQTQNHLLLSDLVEKE